MVSSRFLQTVYRSVEGVHTVEMAFVASGEGTAVYRVVDIIEEPEIHLVNLFPQLHWIQLRRAFLCHGRKLTSKSREVIRLSAEIAVFVDLRYGFFWSYADFSSIYNLIIIIRH